MIHSTAVFTQIYLHTILDSVQEIQSRTSSVCNSSFPRYLHKLILHVISFIAQLRYKEGVFKVIFADGIYCIELGNKSFVIVEKVFMIYFICKFFIGEIKQTGDLTRLISGEHPSTHSSINLLRRKNSRKSPTTFEFNQKHVKMENTAAESLKDRKALSLQEFFVTFDVLYHSTGSKILLLTKFWLLTARPQT